MAYPGWYNPWLYGTYHETIAPLDLLNWFLPYLPSADRASAARYLYSQRAADPYLQEQIGESYNQPAGVAASTNEWLRNVGAIASAGLPGYYDASSPEANWLRTLTRSASTLYPGMTREQQMSWRRTYDELMGQAPSETIRALGAYLYNPTLVRPNYGQAAPLGTYLQGYRVKGGLVGNERFI